MLTKYFYAVIVCLAVVPDVLVVASSLLVFRSC